MKKLLDLIKNKFFLTTLILLGAYLLFAFVSDVWSGASYGAFQFSTWIHFLVMAGLIALVVVGLFLNKKEFVSIAFTIFGVYFVFNSINYVSNIQGFFSSFDGLASRVNYWKSLSYNVRFNIPGLLAELVYGLIGFLGLGTLVCLILGKIVLKNEKLTKVGNILISIVPAAFVLLGTLGLISNICDSIWAHNVSNLLVIFNTYGESFFVSCLASSSLWMSIALVNYFGLPSKEAKVKEEKSSEEKEAE